MEIALHGKYGKGRFAIVDDEDYEYLNQFKWFVTNKGYVVRYKHENNTTVIICIHREILKVIDPRIQIDHKLGDKLDNRKDLLRVCNFSQNNANKRKLKGTSSKYKGVTWDKQANKWRAGITVNQKYKFLGLFNSEIEAAKEYNKKAIEIFGEFALINTKV